MSTTRHLPAVYGAEGAASFAGNFISGGIFFYTQHQLGWGMKENFALAAAQGVVYVVGSLFAEKLARALGRRGALAVAYGGMTLAALGAIAAPSPMILTVLLLAFTGLLSLNWPVLESLASAGADGPQLARRLGVYNLVWSGTGAAAIAVTGLLIEIRPWLLFAVTAGLTGVALVLSQTFPRHLDHETPGHAEAQAEPALQRVRVLALWLSRASLPATYVLIYSLLAMLPSLPVVVRLDPAESTLLASLWMASRFFTFAALAASHWWHTRPGALVYASGGMLASFLLIVLPGAGLWPFVQMADAPAVAVMAGASIALGFCVGLIYFASLYFGMALSQGSTEHGGYHEALIGLGSVLGPGSGAAAAWLWPGSTTPAILAASLVVGLSVAVTCAVPALVARRQ